MAFHKKFLFVSLASLGLLVVSLSFAQKKSQTPPSNAANRPAPGADSGWPRQVANGATTFEIYQPQLDQWEDNRLSGRAAIAVGSGESEPKNYGVAWISARTEVDKVNRQVTLDELKLEKVNFPQMPEKNQEYQDFLQKHYAGRMMVVSLDRLETGLAYATGAGKVKGIPVKNDPPQIIYSVSPSLLILVDGQPALQPFADTKLQRVINTRAVLAFDPGKKKYYLHLYDGWLAAEAITGPWQYAPKYPGDLKKVVQWAMNNRMVDLMQMNAKGAAPSLKVVAEEKTIPQIFVSLGPAELIQTQGEPQLKPIEETQLLYVANTENHIFLHTPAAQYYVLLSGRWFQSASLNGPWAYVAGAELPEDFRKIPEEDPLASVLASVPGTPQAKEALIANSIPQTAAIKREEAKLKVKYDGAPRFAPIESTPIQYGVNTPTPVIQVKESEYYAVENGVWFTSPAPVGPWAVTASVPAAIYSIPASCPIHYVTYVKVYSSTPDTVYVGYTPGYYGTVVSPEEVVVYGTGYYYSPYVGTAWYGAPYTYGCGAAFGWSTSAGWSVGFSVGYGYPMYYPWWGPVGWGWMYAPYPYYPMGYWGGAAYTNVYGHWGNTAFGGTRAAWANPYTGNYGQAGRGATYNSATGAYAAGRAGRNTNVYTGNTVAGAQGVRYNPNTGVVAGGSVVGAGNIYSGEGAVAGRGFAYDTDTGNAIAAGKNNIYASKDGEVYRYDRETGNISKSTGNGQWSDVSKTSPSATSQSSSRDNLSGASTRQPSQMSNREFESLSGDIRGRSAGQHRSGSYSSYRGSMGGARGGGRRR